MIGYQNDVAHGTYGIIYSNPYLFGTGCSIGWERAGRPTNKCSITNLLRTKAYFIVGIMDKYID